MTFIKLYHTDVTGVPLVGYHKWDWMDPLLQYVRVRIMHCSLCNITDKSLQAIMNEDRCGHIDAYNKRQTVGVAFKY